MFFPDPSSNQDVFWGFATVLVDIDSLLADSLVAQLQEDFNVAIRGKDGLGAQGEVFVGDPAVFDQANVVADIPLPNASWQIAVAEKSEPQGAGFIRSPWYWIVATLAAMLSAIIAYTLIDRPRQLKSKVAQATATLNEEVRHRMQAEEQIRYMAQHDALTGLPNRRLFDELSEKALARARRERASLAVLFIDIDGFKEVNDSLGHVVGDRVLKMIAERLQERTRQSDIVARFGGDEFVILLGAECDLAGAKKAATDVVSAVAIPFDIEGRTARVGASIGIAMYPDHGSTLEELIQKSDNAMYRAKQSGKECFWLAGENGGL